ncbi:hypothetical protein [Pseudomonas sp. RIT-PI-S]|uniref:hypothetical protein n=1 Tax=Pseudomonas sp. RIT-PI-S TaxID=3035295 RepID=UPI0021D9A6B1|nr:hypothetical protein [Pseudomonas sp. RIT-PI-S]
MFAKLTKALLLSTCLVAAGVAGTASADERDLIVPVIAGAAVGALIAGNWDNGGHHHYHEPRYAPQPRPVMYVPAPQPVYYQPAPQPVYYRPAPPPRHWEHQRFDGPRW